VATKNHRKWSTSKTKLKVRTESTLPSRFKILRALKNLSLCPSLNPQQVQDMCLSSHRCSQIVKEQSSLLLNHHQRFSSSPQQALVPCLRCLR